MSKKNFVKKLLTDAISAGFILEASYDGEVDYHGVSVDKAYEALTACDEMLLTLLDDAGKRQGSALIIPGLEPDEEIADYSGEWINTWWETNVR